MMARIDKYFIAELQERGYDFDFKKLCDIYRASREIKWGICLTFFDSIFI